VRGRKYAKRVWARLGQGNEGLPNQATRVWQGIVAAHPGSHTVLGVAHARVSSRNLRRPIERSGCANSHARVCGRPCTMRCLARGV